jgi:hypothetical protein
MRLRKDLSPARAHLVAEQVELRWRAQARFPEASRLFFTRQGLEQATEASLAQLKASRFAGQLVWDVGCGVGGDLMALARQAKGVVGIERDPVVALLAQANLDVLGLCGHARVEVGDAAEVFFAREATWHCDPDRRAGGCRTTQIDRSEPSLMSLAAWRNRNPAAAIKLACAAVPPATWQTNTEWHWLGSRGECRQLVVWSGPLAQWPGRRAATLLEAGRPMRTVVEDAPQPPPVAQVPQAYLFELHPAVRAAGLSGTLARQHGLAALAGDHRFLTGPRPVEDPALTAFALVEELPWDLKRVRAYCRQHGLGRLEVKAAGHEAELQRLARALAGGGEAAATLIGTSLGGRRRVLVVYRVKARAGHAPEGESSGH